MLKSSKRRRSGAAWSQWSFLPLLLVLAFGAFAQAPPNQPPADAGRGGIWQHLTPEQRAQLWRSLTPQQKADFWRGLEQNDRRAMRERSPPGDADESARRWMPHRGPDRGEAPPHMMMMPEDRQRLREQIREANRLRRERLEAERGAKRRGRE